MKQVCTLAILISTVLITSCGYKASDDVKATSPQTTTPVIPVLTVDSTGKVTANAPGTNPNTSSNPSGANIVQAAAPSGALNPAHGQPGHRCEIAVGAPLDSKPVVTTTTTTTGTQNAAPAPTITTTTPTTTTPVPTASSGPNPAHGQPGHRCDIAVGAPLNSKPTTTTTTTAPAANTTPINITPVNSGGSKTAASPLPVTPVLPAGNTQSPVATAPGMNPAHGQPGHRCDIAVGAPLNSKPTATKQ